MIRVPTPWTRRLALAAVLLGALCGAGCQSVEPWQRGVLAKAEMTLGDDALAGALREQVFFSKEAASGGAGPAGGGCGCN